tara:strand:- start:691 stop:981 length:291 start_codon:yes stop_codon:yes gene_type:complete
LKSFLENFLLSELCTNKEFKLDIRLFELFKFRFEASINLRFFFFLRIFKAFFSNPLAIITSKNILFNSTANFSFNLKLHDTIPPKALIGSQDKDNL